MIYTLAFADPQVTHFTYWGGREWFDENANTSNLYHAMHQLIRDTWMTNVEITTNADGEASLRAFYGDYNVNITDHLGNSHPVTISLNHNHELLTLYV
jgi:hypothetical protein